jgi:tape measure domain-containing protein
MSGKNLTFKLILGGDSKGLVAATKQSEEVTKKLFDAIKSEAAELKQNSAETAKALGNIIPVKSKELADSLTKSLTAATEIIQDAGDNAKSTAGNFTDFGNKAEKALSQLKSDLAEAKRNLDAFSKTKASPVDIEVAQRQVDQLEKEVQQADQAFSNFHQEVGQANTKLAETGTAAQSAQKGLSTAKFAVNALVGAMAALGVGLGIRELAETADSYTNLSARINIATKNGGNFTTAMAGVHQVALMTNTSLDVTAGLFTKVNDVGKQMGMTQQQSLDLVKTINMAVQTGGGSAQASEAAIVQLTQALQSGVLRGDEFNSIMEQAPGISSALAKSLGVTTGELRKMAENGELSAEKVVKALQDQSAAIEADYAKFPTTIGNALQRISTQWQILIGSMDQANGASATVAQWLVTLADNMGIVETLLNDISSGFVWIGDQLSFIDISVFDSLKSALSSTYDAVKDVIATLVDFGKTIVDILGTSLSNVLAVLSSFTGEATTAAEQVGFLERTLQGLSIAFGFVADGAAAIKIGVNLLAGAFFDLASAANSVLAAVTWGDVSKQFASNADAMKEKAKQYYAEAENDALAFHSKGMQRLAEAAQTEQEKNAQTLLEAKNLVDQLLLENQREVDGKKVTEQEKLNAIQAYAEAAITANKGVMDGTMQADLMTKGYIVTMDEAGKVSVNAWDAAAEGANKASGSADRARKAAVAIGLDLDVSLNRVSAKFKETEGQLNNFAQGLEGLGIKGNQAANVTYEAWLKWLEIAKSQAEIDYAKAKLQQFGNQGKISTGQVEQGLIAIKLQAQDLPDEIDPVTEAFKRLGIQTKEQLKFAAQQALMDYITIRDSGVATAEGIQTAYEKAAQSAAASGDAGVIAATNAANAGRNLEIQIDDTGVAAVKSMDDWTNANYRVRNSAEGIGDGFRSAGQVARDEASSASDAWKEAANAAKGAITGTAGQQARTGTKTRLSYSKEEIQAQLVSFKYDEKRAEQLAQQIFSSSMIGDSQYRNASTAWLAEKGYDTFDPIGGMLGNFNYVAEQLEKYSKNAKAYTSTAALASAAPSVSTPSVSVPEAGKTIQNNITINGKTISVPVAEANQSNFNDFLSELETLKNRM